MKRKIVIVILCLALISLACLEVSSAAVVVAKPPEVATRIKDAPPGGTAEHVAEPTLTNVSQLCARVIASSAQNLRIDADPNARILTHLLNGDLVQVIDQVNADWWQVQRGDDIGFARSIYLQIVECVK